MYIILVIKVIGIIIQFTIIYKVTITTITTIRVAKLNPVVKLVKVG